MESIHEMLDAVVQPLGYATLFAHNGDEAIATFEKERPDIVLTDIIMEPMDGLELAKKLKAIDPEAIVIMMSGQADEENALSSLKLGAFDFLTKPFKVDQLIAAISRAAALQKAKLQDNEEGGEDSLLGDSPAAEKLKQAVSRAANSATPVLLCGENGTRRQRIASVIHKSRVSEADEGPFISVDCNELGEDKIREQLLGPDSEGGALLEQAEGGTLFIANVEALSIETQRDADKLIRDIKTQTRFIFSTSENLESSVESGAFDDSFYYRISNLSIEIPSLRDQSEDIPLIAKSILASLEMESVSISDQARALLQNYRWAGNYTELKEAIEAAAMQCSDDTINPDDLPEKIRDLTSWSSLADHIEEATREYKKRVLRACHGDSEKAASILGCEPGD